nr:hypothetical protein [Corynebacterium xerosis]
MLLQLGDALVDGGDGRVEAVGVGDRGVAAEVGGHVGQGDAGVGQRPDPQQARGVVDPVVAPGAGPRRHGHQPDRVIVPDGAHGHPGDPGEL